MKLFHYTTWDGLSVCAAGVIRPSNIYAKESKAGRALPELVFLTMDDLWEPSVQAGAVDQTYVKAPSSPDTYDRLGIPCWRFTVELESPLIKLIYPHAAFYQMLADALRLRGKVYKWHWLTDGIEWTEAHIRNNNQWERYDEQANSKIV